MDMWKIFAGVILLVAGIIAAVQGYRVVVQCSSTFGQAENFLSSLFGGNAIQECYNAQLIELGGIIVALIGMIVIFYGNPTPRRKR